jgi:hypothetical protein
LAVIAIAITLVFWTSNAQTIIPGPPFPPITITPAYLFEALTFNLTAAQQGPINSKTYANTIKTSKITGKDFLNILAAAFNTNWPTGAQLALDNNSWDIFVVDKTGTNPVFNVSIGINVGDTNVVYFKVNLDFKLRAEKVSERNREIQTQTQYGKVFFHLLNEENGIIYTDLSFDGLDAGTGDYNPTRNYAVIQTDATSVTGDGNYIDGTVTVVEGEVKGSGKWNYPPSQPIPLLR